MADGRENLLYYFHETVNILITCLIFYLLYLIANKVFTNIASLLDIITA